MDVMPGARRRELLGALEEKRFFDRILFEHAEFMRGWFDPTEDTAIRTADRFAIEGEKLWRRVISTSPTASDASIMELIHDNFGFVEPLIAFKQAVARGIAECRLLAIAPAELIEHIALEALFFLGILERVSGRPTPCRSELLLPGRDMMVLLYPRMSFIDQQDSLTTLAYEYGLFWVRRHMEHAMVLPLFFRPEIQNDYIAALNVYQQRFMQLLTEGEAIFAQTGVLEGQGTPILGPVLPASVEAWIRQTINVTCQFRDFMAMVVGQQVTCTIPGRQTNFWPLLGDHIRREADYLINAMDRILQAAQGQTCPMEFGGNRPWEIDWRGR